MQPGLSLTHLSRSSWRLGRRWWIVSVRCIIGMQSPCCHTHPRNLRAALTMSICHELYCFWVWVCLGWCCCWCFCIFCCKLSSSLELFPKLLWTTILGSFSVCTLWFVVVLDMMENVATCLQFVVVYRLMTWVCSTICLYMWHAWKCLDKAITKLHGEIYTGV